MTDLASLRAQLESLKASRRSGVLRTRFGDREVYYKSETEMRDAIASIEGEIASLDGTGVRHSINIRSKGWS